MTKPIKQNFFSIGPVSKDELITVEDEIALVKKFQEGGADAQSAIDKLLLCNRRFVKAVALKYVDQSHSLNDLIAEGNKGVVVAAKKYDPSRGFKFTPYAVWFIRKSIVRAIACSILQNKLNKLKL